MKTGWQMEWENEIRYLAPLRARLNSIAKPLVKFHIDMKNFGLAMEDAAKRMVKAFGSLK